MEKTLSGSKLIEILGKFTAWEWHRFEAYCRSPYLNPQAELSVLVAYLSKKHENLSQVKKTDLADALAAAGEKISGTPNHWISALNKLAEQFVGMERYLQSDHHGDMDVLWALSNRRLEKHLNFLATKKSRQLDEQEHKDIHHFLFPSYQLANMLSENAYRGTDRGENIHLQKASDALDGFFIAEKLRLTCSMLNHQRVIATQYRLTWDKEIHDWLLANPNWLQNEPLIALYYALYVLLTADSEAIDGAYQVFREGLERHKSAVLRPELSELYEYALNACAREIRKQREIYVHEAFRLYRSGLALGLFMTDGELSPWHFKNIVRLGLRTGESDWTEDFIKEKTPLLSRNFQEDALHYNLAELYFATARYSEALDHLNRVEFSDIHYNLGAKVMLAKVYVLQGADEALESLLHAFKVFLGRNQALPQDTLKAYQNFVKILSKIHKTPRSQRKKLKPLIEETELIVFKAWLLEQL